MSTSKSSAQGKTVSSGQVVLSKNLDREVRQPNPEHGQRVGVITGNGQILNHVSDQRVREIFGRRIP